MASGVLFTDDAGRALLVEPTYKEHWEIPGGTVDADESPYDAAVREVREELDLSVRPGRLLVVDWYSPRKARVEGVNFVFAGHPLDAAEIERIRLPADELRGWAWCDAREATRRLSALLARRVAAAHQALATGVTAYLEDGHPVV